MELKSDPVKRCIRKDAKLSYCGTYRYDIVRQWGPKPRILWVMLNPSTADHRVDDATIKKVSGFSFLWGYGGFVGVNLFGLRSTDPSALIGHPDPIGPENDRFIQTWARILRGPVVVAWGNHKAAKARAVDVATYLKLSGCRLKCLKTLADGSPGHPLFLPYAEHELKDWRPQ